ncbi:MAG: dihydrofolate reductase [Deltaproteobacteria bacterium]|nr:dihydrofolate reductase [Deltaproteobacteria bacterium]MCW8892453.1 dihydrofolate reductase [Deltaproteobacteria bacterium]MCW9049749.1 dihydrofolate reductase [Deltaproteobacteria bacterium]
MLISIIAAMAKNRVIGNQGQLPWHLPTDLRRFKHLTMGHTLLMGRQTFEAIGHALPGRRTIILSRNTDYQAQGCEVVDNIRLALQLAEGAEHLFICGGAEIYRQTLQLAERIYLTELDIAVEGDAFFPELRAGEFQTRYCEQSDDKISYQFSILERGKNDHNPTNDEG